MSLISSELKKILVCPLDKGTLEENTASKSLSCSVCGKMYPVKDSIPIMLPEQKGDSNAGNLKKSGGPNGRGR
ncbi:MAG: hypothetical protein A2020_03765 [Lentisphaerae bacterium GWF2_45_14]|nr:MAG: hypothetical protein A2020_03765 [Lentisphaerae bacterium GWF2_45_14]